MKIIVDAFGGDNSPSSVIKGTVAALDAKKGFSVVLTGDEKTTRDLLTAENADFSRIEIIHAPEIITCEEAPATAVKAKKNSSIVKGFEALNTDPDAAGFVSCGSTGAVLTAAIMYTKRIGNIRRASLTPVLPTIKGGNVVLIDSGANPECTADMLLQFAKMGSVFAEAVLDIKTPRVAILSNGTEDLKGNTLVKEAFALIKEDASLNFIGQTEGRDIMSGNIDVVVSDGFSGNIALKSSEGVALGMFDIIKQNIMAGGLRAKIGYLFLKPALKKVAKTMDYNEKGGAVLLGLNKLIIKGHGASGDKAVKSAILQAVNYAESDLVGRITKAFIS
ncbi:MAG: phosphate acyltransferase PlsX [Christensenellaceae bacterium]|jgi:glycerol-3-phosphate acyltransferase PlsX|nr:phosphate acyltransferase PlsX [Christensenellaceae bacterium]